MESVSLNTSEYKKISKEESFNILKTSIRGLAESEAEKRLEVFGYNEIEEEKRNLFLTLLLRYWGPMPWLLELAMALSFLLKHYIEGIIIFVLLTINAVIGQIHSRHSQKAVSLLKKKLAVGAKVLRDGKWVLIEAKEIVPGDIIALKLGDIVPADTLVVNGELAIDESALTGESLPMEVRQSGIVYSSSVVKRGEATALVINTGVHTYFGKTAELVKIANPKSHQEEVMMEIVKYMMYLGISASLLVSIYALFMHMGILLILTCVVVFLMGVVPVALPAVLTIVQAVGAMELAREGVFVTRLDSIEDAASIDILCIDKTGTITQNKLSVADCIAFSGHTKEDVARVAVLASREEGMDIIDLAVIEYAKNTLVDISAYRQIVYTPFDPSTKRTEALIELREKRIRVMKGAAQVVLALCREIDGETLAMITNTIEELSRKGYRTIAVAQSGSDESDNLNLVGLVSLADPPRPDSRDMIAEAQKLGIKSIMLTGDNIAIAKEIARFVGMGDNIIRLTDIDSLTEDEQARVISNVNGFAEIYPEDKYRIVKLLQSRGHMVGMTGDGVNDAPALKQAELGIAVSNATDVAKASASVVLTEEGVQVIIDAVRMSRRIYQRMLTWVINKVTKVIEFVVLLTVSFFWLHDIVLSLLGISMLVFANDFVTMSLATDNVTYTGNPNKWNVKDITVACLIPGALLVIEDIIVIMSGMSYYHLGWEHLRSLVMLNLIFNSQFRVLIVRERRHFWSSMPGRELLLLSTATILGFGLTATYGLFVPSLTSFQVLSVLIFSAVFTFAIDFPKFYIFRKLSL